MVCSNCQNFVSDKEYNYSIDNFEKVLCRECQGKYTNLKNKHTKRKKKSTPEAQKIYEILLKNGFDAKLEQWDGFKHIDIAIPDYMVNIEIDGKQHQNNKQALADLKRTYYSFKKGYVTLRIPNELVQENIFETAKYIMKFLKESESQLNKELEDGLSLMKKQIKAVSAIIENNHKILLIQRAKDPWKGMWGTPGGKIEKGESETDAIIREISEELSVKFIPIKEIKKYYYEDENHVCVTTVFLGKIEGNIKTKEDEIADLKWLSPKEALDLPLASTNKQRLLDLINNPYKYKNMNKPLIFIICLIIVFLVAFIGSIFTSKNTSSAWYESIKPKLTPPNYVFPIVWNILFLLISISLYLAWTSAKTKQIIVIAFAINFFLNILWSFLFFYLKSPKAAFIEVIFLWLSILSLILVTYKINKTSSYLLMPYLAWVSFASLLNYLSV